MRFLVFLFIVSISPASMSQDATQLDLLDVLSLAKQYDPTLQAAQFQHQAGQQIETQGRAKLLPQIDLNADYGLDKASLDYPDDASRTDVDSQSSRYGLSLSLKQALFDSDAWLSFREAQLQQQQAALNFQQQQQTFLLKIASAYFAYLQAQDSLRAIVAKKNAFEQALQRANLSFKIGSTAITDKLEAQSRFELAIAEEIDAQNLRDISQSNLSLLIKQNVSRLAKLDVSQNLAVINDKEIDFWQQQVETNNVDIRLSQLELKIAQQKHQAAFGKMIPQVAFTASQAFQNQFSTFANSQVNSGNLQFGVSMSLPLFSGGENMATKRQQAALVNYAKNILRQAQLDASLKTQTLWSSAKTAFQRINAYERALETSMSVLHATQKGLEVGLRTNLDLLDAQQQVFTTQNQLATSRYQALLTQLQLKAHAGILDERDLVELNRFLQKS